MADCDNFQVKTFANESLDSIVTTQRTEFQLAMNYKEHTRPLVVRDPDPIITVTLYRVISFFDLMCVCARATHQKGGVE
jgi:hypothetical protein